MAGNLPAPPPDPEDLPAREPKQPGALKLVFLSRLARTKQAEAIARITGQSAQWVLDVLTGSEEKGQRGFTQDIQRIQEIRKEL